MGYQTYYNLSMSYLTDDPEKTTLPQCEHEVESDDFRYCPVCGKLVEKLDIIDVAREQSCADSYGLKCADIEGGGNDSFKWYDHEVDMIKFSEKFPSILFTLKGEGEENDDIWIKYFHRGKKQTCKARITFDNFDVDKLK